MMSICVLYIVSCKKGYAAAFALLQIFCNKICYGLIMSHRENLFALYNNIYYEQYLHTIL